VLVKRVVFLLNAALAIAIHINNNIMYIIYVFMYNMCNVSVYNPGYEAVLIYLNSFNVFTAFL